MIGPASITRLVSEPRIRSETAPSMTMTPPGALASRRSTGSRRRTSPPPINSCACCNGMAGRVPRIRGCGIGSAVHRAIETNARMLDRPPPVTGASESAQRTSGLERSPIEIAACGAADSYPTLDTEIRDSCAVSSRSMWPRSASARSSTCARRNEAADAKSGASASAERSPATVRSPTSVAPISPSRSRVLLLKSTSQFRVLFLHSLQLRHLGSAELARTRYRSGNAYRLRVLQVCVNGSYYDARLHGHEV